MVCWPIERHARLLLRCCKLAAASQVADRQTGAFELCGDVRMCCEQVRRFANVLLEVEELVGTLECLAARLLATAGPVAEHKFPVAVAYRERSSGRMVNHRWP